MERTGDAMSSVMVIDVRLQLRRRRRRCADGGGDGAVDFRGMACVVGSASAGLRRRHPSLRELTQRGVLTHTDGPQPGVVVCSGGYNRDDAARGVWDARDAVHVVAVGTNDERGMGGGSGR